MFGPKKTKVSKADLKKAVVSTNEKLKSANTRMEADIKTGKDELKLLESKHKEALKALKDTQDLQGYARNELEALQEEVDNTTSQVKKALYEVEELSERNNALIADNDTLEAKKASLEKSVALLNKKKIESKEINIELKEMKKEYSDGQETLSLLGRELASLESEVDAYDSRKSAAESEFGTFKGEIERAKRMAEEEVREAEEFRNKLRLANGEEMGRLDHAMADRLSELKDLDDEKRVKEYRLSTVQARIGTVENRVNDAEDRIEYAIKKEQEKVSKIKGDFRDWKVAALDEVARLKIKKKIENINKAGLKEILDG
jgi:chromosome segregation ATPase